MFKTGDNCFAFQYVTAVHKTDSGDLEVYLLNMEGYFCIEAKDTNRFMVEYNHWLMVSQYQSK